MRLFMFPWINHCGGGPGRNLRAVTALANWVEKSIRPIRSSCPHDHGAADPNAAALPYPGPAKYQLGSVTVAEFAVLRVSQEIRRSGVGFDPEPDPRIPIPIPAPTRL